ncbi:MAG: terpene cyclase/mutase family protein [Planctomycetota bacterium]|jgi:squalene-hopene/tetraprenyl-beta-curcumene cyclase|nr:terpene cyclase/mutase family protein [Planctomycetota bacterium]MDP6940456.1 terpene cyclase/mutase family protein [Planctomycetota bacterium]
MLTLSALLLALPCSIPQGPSIKDLFDQELAAFRLAQEPDGNYGSRLDTAHVLIAMAHSPRAYREDDGPFIRLASEWLIAASHADAESHSKATDAASAFALHSLDTERYAKTIQRLKKQAGEEAWLAWVNPQSEKPAIDLLQELPPVAGLRLRAETCAQAGALLAKVRKTIQAPTADSLLMAQKKGNQFLLESRGESGLWEIFGHPEPGISALAARALLASDSQEVQNAAYQTLDFLKTLQKEDGSIHGGRLPVYVTSVAMMALAAGERAQDQDALGHAANFLRATQSDEGESYSENDRYYGGIGYGGDLRPDLSNLQYALQALHDSGATSEDPAFQRALVFLQRSQNRSESNPKTYKKIGTGEEVRAGNDGGATYMPGDSPAGYVRLDDGSLVARSYGSMTYALLKCYIFAGLQPEDPRVEAVVQWLGHHWTLEVNPGFDTLRDPRAGFQGLYYYYLSLAEALSAAKLETIEGSDGQSHNWRAELQTQLLKFQNEDGSWVNDQAERWWEGNPVLCTAYALSALAATK